MNEKWNEYFKRRREEYGVTQKALAKSVRISKDYLNKIERGKKLPADKLKKLLDIAVELKNPQYPPLEIKIDFLRVRFPTHDVKYIIEKVLKMNFPGHWIHEFYAPWGYTEQFIHFNIHVMASEGDDKERGTLLELRGQGCRQMEGWFRGRDWYDFFRDCRNADGFFRRFDLAVDDYLGLLDVPELIEKHKCGECITRFKSFEYHGSGRRFNSEIENGESFTGSTLYLGSKSSNIHFCIYEKDKEQLMKKGVPLDEAPIINRFEIRLLNERAESAIDDLLCYKDAEKTAFEIINEYVDFIDLEEGVSLEDCKQNVRWALFMGENRGKLKLASGRPQLTIHEMIAWISKQVLPTAQMISEFDRRLGTKYGANLNYAGTDRLADKHWKLIEQMTDFHNETVAPPPTISELAHIEFPYRQVEFSPVDDETPFE